MAVFETDLGENGGVIAPASFSDFVSWIDEEYDKWSWLAPSTPGLENYGFLGTPQESLSHIRRVAREMHREKHVGSHGIAQILNGNYVGQPPVLFHSSSDVGVALLAIKDKWSARDAATAYGILRGALNIDFMRQPKEFRLMSLVANPASIDAAAILEQLSVERRTSRANVTKLENRLADAVRVFEDNWAGQLKRTRDARKRGFRRLVKVHRAISKAQGDDYSKLKKELEATKAAYAEHMRLRAAVQYWEEKRDGHLRQRGNALRNLRWFGGLAAVAAGLGFFFAGSFVLEASGLNMWGVSLGKAGSNDVSPAFFVVVSAALAFLLTFIFWAARVFLRLYLTENHMQADAEERRVMTQTYLALINESAAKDDDRLVILNALFRPGTVGIGQEDAPSEIAAPAILARILDNRGSMRG